MMEEVRAIDRAVGATETLFVVDSMAGQDAVQRRARLRCRARPDGRHADQGRRRRARRRGAVGAPGDRPADPVRRRRREDRRARGLPAGAHGLAHPRHGRRARRWSSRCTRRSTATRPRGSPRKIAKGKDFDLDDLREQLRQLEPDGRHGGARWTSCRPRRCRPGALAQVNEREIRRQIAIIGSMTPDERRWPGHHRRLAQAADRGRCRRARCRRSTGS